MSPEISIVIVSWNVSELLKRSIQSIDKEADVPFELFVIDNASEDGTADFLKHVKIDNQLCFGFKVIINKKGQGFAKGSNQGMREAKGKNILLFAPDAELFPKTLSALLKEAASDSQIGVLGGKILNENGTVQTSVSCFPTIWTHIGGRLRLHKLFPSSAFTQGLRYAFDYSKVADVPSVKGALFFITPEAIKKVGLLDERFFIWFEETDYCKRVWNAKLKVRYTPEAIASHVGLASMKKMTFWSRQLIWNSSLRKYFVKYYGLPAGIFISVLDPLLVALGTLAAKLFSAKK